MVVLTSALGDRWVRTGAFYSVSFCRRRADGRTEVAGDERADKLCGPFGKAPDALRPIETPRVHHAARQRGKHLAVQRSCVTPREVCHGTRCQSIAWATPAAAHTCQELVAAALARHLRHHVRDTYLRLAGNNAAHAGAPLRRLRAR